MTVPTATIEQDRASLLAENTALRQANEELVKRNRQHHADKRALNEEITRLRYELEQAGGPIAVVGSTTPLPNVRTVTTPDEYERLMGHPAPREIFEKKPVLFHAIEENKMAEEKPKLSTEQVHAELQYEIARLRRIGDPKGVAISPRVDFLIDQLPKTDVVTECGRAYKAGFVAEYGDDAEWSDHLEPERRSGLVAALRRFCELEGITVPKYLDPK